MASEFQGRIITLTGLDRVGKETQSGLLKAAFFQSDLPVDSMSFPDYGNHWAAEFVHATLKEEQLLVQRGRSVEMDAEWSADPLFRAAGPRIVFSPNKKDPYLFQMWQAADRRDRQPWIKETLRHRHIIADRYEIDAEAFGWADGCDREWLRLNSRLLYRPSDLALVLVGSPFPRPGERPDINERDPVFQQKVRTAYETLCSEEPSRYVLVNVDDYRDTNPITSKWRVHCALVHSVRDKLGLPVSVLSREEVQRHEDARLGAALQAV